MSKRPKVVLSPAQRRLLFLMSDGKRASRGNGTFVMVEGKKAGTMKVIEALVRKELAIAVGAGEWDVREEPVRRH